MIKKLINVALFMGMSYGALAQSPVTITGDLKTDRPSPISLYKVVDGKATEVANEKPSKDGKFGFIFYPEYEGFYVLGTGNGLSMMDAYKFYFKGGEKLSLAITDTSYTLTGKENSKENIVLTQWHDFIYPIEKKSVWFMKGNSTYVDFFPQFETAVAQSKTFLDHKTTGDAHFDAAMKQVIQFDLASYATNFIMTPRTAHPSVEEFSPYFAALNPADFTTYTQPLYSYPFGIRLMDGLIAVAMRKNGTKWQKGPAGVKVMIDVIPNDTLKGEIVLESVSHLKSFSAYKEINDTLGKYVITDNQKSRNVAIAAPLAELKTGEDGYKFSYPDTTGKVVNMTDLKGKVILVDVWATWCGPCRAEIPYLKKLVADMKDKNVAFVSISVDNNKDHEKWKKMVADQQLAGIQLFGSDHAQFLKLKE